MKTNESTYRMVDCVYLLCVFDVFSFAALGERKSEETSGKKPKKRVVLLLLWTETGENSRLSLRGSGYFWHPFTRVRY